MKKIKLTELNKLDDLNQNELLKITGGAAPTCCCSCGACSCTCSDESCNEESSENGVIAGSHKGNTGGGATHPKS